MTNYKLNAEWIHLLEKGFSRYQNYDIVQVNSNKSYWLIKKGRAISKCSSEMIEMMENRALEQEIEEMMEQPQQNIEPKPVLPKNIQKMEQPKQVQQKMEQPQKPKTEAQKVLSQESKPVLKTSQESKPTLKTSQTVLQSSQQQEVVKCVFPKCTKAMAKRYLTNDCGHSFHTTCMRESIMIRKSYVCICEEEFNEKCHLALHKPRQKTNPVDFTEYFTTERKVVEGIEIEHTEDEQTIEDYSKLLDDEETVEEVTDEETEEENTQGKPRKIKTVAFE